MAHHNVRKIPEYVNPENIKRVRDFLRKGNTQKQAMKHLELTEFKFNKIMEAEREEMH